MTLPLGIRTPLFEMTMLPPLTNVHMDRQIDVRMDRWMGPTGALRILQTIIIMLSFIQSEYGDQLEDVNEAVRYGVRCNHYIKGTEPTLFFNVMFFQAIYDWVPKLPL